MGQLLSRFQGGLPASGAVPRLRLAHLQDEWTIAPLPGWPGHYHQSRGFRFQFGEQFACDYGDFCQILLCHRDLEPMCGLIT